jgi:hypothetical protein
MSAAVRDGRDAVNLLNEAQAAVWMLWRIQQGECDPKTTKGEPALVDYARSLLLTVAEEDVRKARAMLAGGAQ